MGYGVATHVLCVDRSYTGLSLAVAIDICIRHGLVAQLEALLFPPPSEGSSTAAGEATCNDAAVALLEEVCDVGITNLVGT